MASNPKREEFLISMYERMWENISRSITLSWQPFVVLLALGAIMNVALLGTIPVWLGASIGAIVVGWFFGHIYDVNEWFWRNHLIVANLENHFMDAEDKKKINPFLGDIMPPEKAAKLFSTMRPHFFFATALSCILVAFTLIFETIPAILNNAWPVMAGRAMPLLITIPYVTALATYLWVRSYRIGRSTQYQTSYKLAKEGRLDRT